MQTLKPQPNSKLLKKIQEEYHLERSIDEFIDWVTVTSRQISKTDYSARLLTKDYKKFVEEAEPLSFLIKNQRRKFNDYRIKLLSRSIDDDPDAIITSPNGNKIIVELTSILTKRDSDSNKTLEKDGGVLGRCTYDDNGYSDLIGEVKNRMETKLQKQDYKRDILVIWLADSATDFDQLLDNNAIQNLKEELSKVVKNETNLIKQVYLVGYEKVLEIY